MNTTNWTESWFVWGIALGIGFPLVSVLLEEIIQRLRRRKSRFALILVQIKNIILPTIVLLIFVRDVFRLEQYGMLTKTLETLLWISIINVTVSGLNLLVFDPKANQDSWYTRIPKVVVDLAQFLAIVVGSAIVLARVWGVDLAWLLIVLAATFIVIALALKEPIGGVLTGILVVLERPFRLGDWLKVGEFEGRVVDINWRTVHLCTSDRQILVLPYQIIGQQVVCNYSKSGELSASSITVGFSYDNSPNLVKRIMVNTALSVKGILSNPPPECYPISYLASTITYELEFYIQDFEKLKLIQGELMSCLWYAARRNGLILYHYNYECNIDLPPNRAENPKHKLAKSLSAIPAFMAVAKEPRQLEDLVKGTRIQHFGVGEPIITQGDRVRALYIIIVGCVDLVVNDEYGELSVLNLGKGEFFGVESMFSREPSSASFVATEDMEVLVIGADAVLSMIRRQPNLSTEITKVIEVRKNAINVAKRTNANEKRKYLGKEDEDQEQLPETTVAVTPIETERDLSLPTKELAEKKDLVGKKEALPEKTKINK